MVLAAPGKTPGRLRPAPGAWRRGRTARRPRQLSRRLRRLGDDAGSGPLRRADLRHHGAFVHPGARRRGRARSSHFARSRPEHDDPADRHLRYRARAPREGGRAGAEADGDRRQGARRAPGQRRSRRARAAGAARSSTRAGCSDVGDLRERRPRRDSCCNATRAEACRSTATASAPASPPRRTRRRSIAPTSSRSTPACRKRKRSEGKATWPGRKQVCRRYAEDGTMAGDVLTARGRRSGRRAPDPAGHAPGRADRRAVARGGARARRRGSCSACRAT